MQRKEQSHTWAMFTEPGPPPDRKCWPGPQRPGQSGARRVDDQNNMNIFCLWRNQSKEPISWSWNLRPFTYFQSLKPLSWKPLERLGSLSISWLFSLLSVLQINTVIFFITTLRQQISFAVCQVSETGLATILVMTKALLSSVGTFAHGTLALTSGGSQVLYRRWDLCLMNSPKCLGPLTSLADAALDFVIKEISHLLVEIPLISIRVHMYCLHVIFFLLVI